MKLPTQIDPALFAPCGMNCMVCYRHCDAKKPCAGCLSASPGKPAHCRVCAIKDCAAARGVSYCYQCQEFPCKRVRALDQRYQKRYQASLIANSRDVQQKGVSIFFREQALRYTCPTCGGVINLHDKVCSACHLPWTSPEST